MRRNLTIAVLFTLIVVQAVTASAQTRRRSVSTTGSAGGPEPLRWLIDVPTAGTLPRGSFDVEMRVFKGGGVLLGTDVGLSNRLQLGLSYGAEGIIAESNPVWNPRVEFQVKLQVITEDMSMPAIAIGFASQGFGKWIDSLDRYEVKSRGFFAVASKGYLGPGGNLYTGVHAGINYSLETNVDKDETPNFFFGFDAKFPNDFAVLADYDMALNDDRDTLALGKGWGYLNLGFRWLFMERMMIEADVKNILNNREGVKSLGRELRILYLEYF